MQQQSMVFVQAALRAGGVNIVIEPLNAIIKSQLRELKYLSPYISMEQLLSEEEAKYQRSPSTVNRLQIIINEVKVGQCRMMNCVLYGANTFLLGFKLDVKTVNFICNSRTYRATTVTARDSSGRRLSKINHH